MRRTMSTYRHLSVVVPLVRSDPECGLERTLQIAFLSIHIQEFRPRLVGVSWGVKTALVCFLRLLLVVQANAEVAQDLPLQPGLAVRNVLRLEVRDLRTEDRPDAQVLGQKT